MLEKLIIKNLAIIEDIEIEFHPNQTALTGETGAGKSLIIDSLKLIFGARADSDLIRHQAEESVIKAFFNIDGKAYVIERWISKKERNKILINDKPSTLNELKELGLKIGDIHEQHDTLELLKPETAIIMIDELGDYEKVFNDYTILRHKYIEATNKLDQALKQTKQNQETLEAYKTQYEQLTKAHLTENELTTLNIQIETLTHQKDIIEALNKAYQGLKYIDDENILYTAQNALESIKSIDASFDQLKERIETIYYEAVDVKNELYNELDRLKDLSLLELDTLQERYFFLKELENDYQKSIDELIIYIDTLSDEIMKYDNYEGFIDKLKKEKENAYNKAYSKALELSKLRQLTAKKLEKAFISIIKNLAISYCDFKVKFSLTELNETGIDEVLFLISLNEGEPLMPFYKVASGGELSRSMLALKIIYIKAHQLKLAVFDEIDLGISGQAASSVSLLLSSLSKEVQIITITHLPQVAALADLHYHITKHTKASRTTTALTLLEGDERLYNLAYMLSGQNLSEGAILHAKSLLAKKK